MLVILKYLRTLKKFYVEIRFCLFFYFYEKPRFILWRMRTKRSPINLACVKPFVDLEIDQNGDCYLCCKSWMSFSVGNVNKSSIEDIFNSAKSQMVRMTIYMDDMRYCNKQLCNIINSPNHKYIVADELTESVFCDDALVSDIISRELKLSSPQMITEIINEKCNIKCRFCWTSYSNKQTDTNALGVFNDYVLKNINNIKMISFCGGEPLIQKHVHDIVSAAQNKPVKFYFTSNLNFISEKMKQSLRIIDIGLFHISLNAISKETYDKIVCGGDWPAVMDNLKYVFELRGTCLPSMKIHISMVVTSSNYMEMLDFVRFGVINSVDKIIFYPMNEYNYPEQKSLQIDKHECRVIIGFLKDEIFSKHSGYIEVEALRCFVNRRTADQSNNLPVAYRGRMHV